MNNWYNTASWTVMLERAVREGKIRQKDLLFYREQIDANNGDSCAKVNILLRSCWKTNCFRSIKIGDGCYALYR